MIRNYEPHRRVTEFTHMVTFEYGTDGSGFAFPCDKDGNILADRMSPESKANYEDCMAHPERFLVFNEVRTHRNIYLRPGQGDCHCGQHVELFNQYMGACQCPNCGQWYNVFGEELLPPDQWEE